MIGEFIRYVWLGVGILWLLGAFASKRTVLRQSGSYRWVEMFGLFVCFSLLFNDRWFGHGVLATRIVPDSAGWQAIGGALTLSGCGFAVWARFYLGGNWSSNITLKENHELMRGGPYRIVRHPIYAGFLLAICGTAIALGEVRGLIAVAPAVAAWRHKANTEERLMVQQFGTEYERYRAEVKGLIPFLW